jgi:hypothetical protein
MRLGQAGLNFWGVVRGLKEVLIKLGLILYITLFDLSLSFFFCALIHSGELNSLLNVNNMRIIKVEI